jgi:hypothetical protein
MNRLLTLAVLLFLLYRSQAQTPEALVRDVQANVSSLSQLKKALKNQAAYRDPHDHWWGFDKDTTGLLGHKVMAAAYRYKYRANKKTIRQLVFLYVIYQGEQIGYLRIEEDVYPTKRVFLKYVDSAYATRVLTPYNNEYHTDFSWPDLYEDNWKRFVAWGSFEDKPTPEELDSSGTKKPWFCLSNEMKQCIPHVIHKDHQAIAKYSKSFNPVRKAYGAACLYVLQQLGEPLNPEEDQLLETIRQSDERIDHSVGCMLYRLQMINTILTKELDDIVSIVKKISESAR